MTTQLHLHLAVQVRAACLEIGLQGHTEPSTANRQTASRGDLTIEQRIAKKDLHAGIPILGALLDQTLSDRWRHALQCAEDEPVCGVDVQPSLRRQHRHPRSEALQYFGTHIRQLRQLADIHQWNTLQHGKIRSNQAKGPTKTLPARKQHRVGLPAADKRTEIDARSQILDSPSQAYTVQSELIGL